MTTAVDISVTQGPSFFIELINPAAQNVEVNVSGVPALIEVISDNIIERIIEVTPFTKVLNGLSAVVDQSEHGLSVVRNLRVTKPDGEIVEVQENILGTTVQVDSNISLDDHILFIY
jgi:hypothetical protein